MRKLFFSLTLMSTLAGHSATSGTIGSYTLTPGEGEVMEISSIKVDFPDTGIMGIDEPDTSEITLISDSGIVYKVAKTRYTFESYAELSFAPEGESTPVTITSGGTYTLTIPAGAFMKYNKPAQCNDEIKAVYEIEGDEEPPTPPTPEVSPFENYSTTPINESSVGQFTTFEISFPDMTDGLDWPIDASKITLTSEDGETNLVGNTPQLSQLRNLIVGFSNPETSTVEHLTIMKAGNYTITIPEGLLSVYGDSDTMNPEIKINFTVNPSLNFNYKISPDPSKVYSSLSEVSILPNGAIKNISLSKNSETATLACGESSYNLTAATTEAGVVYTLSEEAVITPGEWTLTIAENALKGVNEDDIEIFNQSPVTAVYKIKEAATFPFSITPAEGAELTILTKYTVDVLNNPKSVKVNAEAGTPKVTVKNGEALEMTAKVSGKSVMFAPTSGAINTPGEYTVEIPKGYIITTDSDGLTAELSEISSTFTIIESASADYSTGYFIFNEGWFGHDAASITHISPEGMPTYNAFTLTNPTHSLGISGTYITRYGDKIYTVAKQEGSNTSGIAGGVVTSFNSESLQFYNELLKTPGGQPHALAPASERYGYLTTANGIYPIDLELMEAEDVLPINSFAKNNCGETISYHGKVYVVVKDWDLIVIDPTDNSFKSIDCGPLAAPFITADGSLWFATMQEDKPFVRLDTEAMTPDFLSIDFEEGMVAKIATPWQTWRPSPIAADLKENVVYYATKDQATQIARMNLTTGEFNPSFITLPGTESNQQCLYGKGISVDPATGEIVLNVTESGYGTHYLTNIIYRCDPSTGEIINGKTIVLSRDYWFPSMNLWCGYSAPELKLSNIEVPYNTSKITIDLAEATTLSLGNTSLIDYTLEFENTSDVLVEETDPGVFSVTFLNEDGATGVATATFMGMETSQTLTVTRESGVTDICVEDGRFYDVYSPTGIIVLRKGRKADVDNLPAGLYIINGKKVKICGK